MGIKDKGYKQLFSHAQMVEELLRDFVKEDWVKLLDFKTLKKYNNSFVSDDLKERFDDVIWTVKWGEQQLYIYILLEFQSDIDFYMSNRMMTYLGLLYQDLLKTKAVKSGDKLPPVLPIVLYNGEPHWNASTNIKEIVTTPPRGFEKFIPDFQFLLIDEGKIGNAELESLQTLVSALFQLERQQTPETVRNIVSKLIDWLKAPEQQSLRRAFTVWLARVILPSRYPDDSIPEFNDLQEVNAMLSETVKSWPAKWMAEGEERGKELGKEFGQAMICKKMHKNGLSVEKIAEFTGIEPEKVLQLIEKINTVQEPAEKY
jgi:predicted transposase/invertase (TIGR01784 family)